MKLRVAKRKISRLRRMLKVFLRKSTQDTHTRWAAAAFAHNRVQS